MDVLVPGLCRLLVRLILPQESEQTVSRAPRLARDVFTQRGRSMRRRWMLVHTQSAQIF